MAEYRLMRRNTKEDRGWLLTTKGSRDYVTSVLKMNLDSEELEDMDWKMEKIK